MFTTRREFGGTLTLHPDRRALRCVDLNGDGPGYLAEVGDPGIRGVQCRVNLHVRLQGSGLLGGQDLEPDDPVGVADLLELGDVVGVGLGRGADQLPGPLVRKVLGPAVLVPGRTRPRYPVPR